MDELGLSAADAASWFSHQQEHPFVLVQVSCVHWAAELKNAVRRCYITDDLLASKAIQHGLSHAEILASRLPDPGSVMAGDFGEILVYIYHAAKAHPTKLFGPKKWRLKQDRTKPAPFSDVVHLFLPNWPSASKDDAIFCSEVKTKSTDSGSTPIASAIADAEKDRTSRLARTLVWLRDRGLTEDLGSVHLNQLQRFIDTTDYPAAQRHFCAVAVICAGLVKAELANNRAASSPKCTLVVVVVPNLKDTYTAVFEAALGSLPPKAGS